MLDDEQHVDPVERTRQRDQELRAAVDVMFEALSHIQASLETSSKEQRRNTYQTFKEALYDRFEHLVDERMSDEEQRTWKNPQLEADKNGEDADSGDGDTLEKMWPAVADKA